MSGEVGGKLGEGVSWRIGMSDFAGRLSICEKWRMSFAFSHLWVIGDLANKSFKWNLEEGWGTNGKGGNADWKAPEI